MAKKFQSNWRGVVTTYEVTMQLRVFFIEIDR